MQALSASDAQRQSPVTATANAPRLLPTPAPMPMKAPFDLFLCPWSWFIELPPHDRCDVGETAAIDAGRAEEIDQMLRQAGAGSSGVGLAYQWFVSWPHRVDFSHVAHRPLG